MDDEWQKGVAKGEAGGLVINVEGQCGLCGTCLGTGHSLLPALLRRSGSIEAAVIWRIQPTKTVF